MKELFLLINLATYQMIQFLFTFALLNAAMAKLVDALP